MSDFQTNAGSVFSVSAAAPSTYDETGYEALTFTPATSSEIVAYQGPNPEWDVKEDDSYSALDKASVKTSRRLGSGSINLKYKKANTAFWDIIEAAELSKDDVLSVQYAHANGVDLRWYTIQVSKSGEIQGGADDWLMREIAMLFQTPVVKGTV
jgi:hypothetical protein